MSSRNIDPQSLELAIQLYENGASMRDAATKAGISSSGLQYQMNKRGIKRRPQGEGLSIKLRKNKTIPNEDELKQLYVNQKMSMRQIADKYNISRDVVEKDLQRIGVTIRKSGDPVVEASKARPRNLNGRWRGGQWKLTSGYVKVLKPHHRRADYAGYVNRSVIIWEQHHQKSLPDGYIIHHKNNIKHDDRPENLEAMTDFSHRSHHSCLRNKLQKWGIEIN
jgi:transposase